MRNNRGGKTDLSGQPEQVYAAALRCLSRRDYAREELRQRLLRRGADADAADEALVRLTKQGYLDDVRFAAGRTRLRREYSRRGRGMVRSELLSLGVDEGIIAATLEEEYDEEQEQAVVEAVVSRAMRQIMAVEDKALRLKRICSLQRRLLYLGFRPALVYETVNRYAEE